MTYLDLPEVVDDGPRGGGGGVVDVVAVARELAGGEADGAGGGAQEVLAGGAPQGGAQAPAQRGGAVGVAAAAGGPVATAVWAMGWGEGVHQVYGMKMLSPEWRDERGRCCMC